MLKKESESTVRDQLALLRTEMANERTLLSYLRTALMLIATGGTVLKLLADTLPLHVIGWSIIAIGIAVGFWGFMRFRQFQNRFRAEEENLDS